MYVEIGRLAIERFADRTDDSFIATTADLMFITGARNAGAAVRKIERLCRVARESAEAAPVEDDSPSGSEVKHVRSPNIRANRTCITVEPEGNHWRIALRNFAEKQGFAPRNGARTAPYATATATATDTRGNRDASSRPERRTPRTPPARAARDDQGADRAAAAKASERKPDDYPPEVLALCRNFLDARQRCWPGLKQPTKSSSRGWMRDMDRLLRLGPPGEGATPVSVDQVRWVIGFLFDPDSDSEVAQFWRTNVKSPRKLRQHWEEILMKAHAERVWHERRRRREQGTERGRATVERATEEVERRQRARMRRTAPAGPDASGSAGSA